MTYLLATPVIWFLLIYVLWIFYLAVMALKRARDEKVLSTPALILGTPVLWIGLALDVLANVLVMTILLLEFPKEALVTSRLKRHILTGTGWRYTFSKWFCENLLDTFDPSGCHCK